MKLVLVLVGIGAVVTLATLGLSIATFIKVHREPNTSQPTTQESTSVINPSLSTTGVSPVASNLVSSMNITGVMNHLKQLQRIADGSNNTRAVSTIGFNRTLDYIVDQLTTNTNFNVSTSFFNIRQFALNRNPILVSSVNGVSKNYTYSTNLAAADFHIIDLSGAANFPDFVPISVIPNVGCSDADWLSATLPPAGRVALVKRGVCAFDEKGELAAKYNAAGLLLYNDGASPDRLSPMAISLGQDNTLPALFLSYAVGQALADAAIDPSNNVSVQLTIDVQNLPLSPVGNICADTPTGDPTQTIVIGSHSDSVPAGPGINDNGQFPSLGQPLFSIYPGV